MNTNKRLKVLLQDPIKTSNAIDSLLIEIKQESTKIYDDVFKNFNGDYKNEYSKLRTIAENLIDSKSAEIRNKHFDILNVSNE